MKVVTSKTKDDILIQDIKTTFKLNERPYSTIDKDLLLLAFVPTCKIDKKYLKTKYGTCDHQSLEFLGDKILYGVMADILYESLGLGGEPSTFTTLMTKLTNNRILTDLMVDVDACKFVRTEDYTINNNSKNFHNQCADSFEALVGALFIHFKEDNYCRYIKEWILKYTKIPYILRIELDRMGFIDEPVYIINNREDLRNAYLKEYEDLIKKYKEINPDEIVDIPIISLDYFSEKCYIVNPDTPIDVIYSYLGWKYEDPINNNGILQLIGYPKGQKYIIAMGDTFGDVLTEAEKYLISKGYIMNNIDFKRNFSK